jgi:hypothetical protein
MFDESTLLPPLPLIHERLTRNIQERDRLRTLLRLAVAAQQEGTGRAEGGPPRPGSPARPPGEGVRP